MACRASPRCWITPSRRDPTRRARAAAVKVDDVNRTPSARMLTEMRQTGESFFQLAQRMSKCTRTTFSIFIAQRASIGGVCCGGARSHEKGTHRAADKWTSILSGALSGGLTARREDQSAGVYIKRRLALAISGQRVVHFMEAPTDER